MKLKVIGIIIVCFVMIIPIFFSFVAYPVQNTVLAHISVVDTHIWDGGATDNLASNGTNWETDVAPIAGDHVIINSGSKNITWNIAVILNTFTVYNYTGRITLTTIIGNTGVSSIGSGTLDGGLQIWYVRGDFSVNSSSILTPINRLNVIVDSVANNDINLPWSISPLLGMVNNINFQVDTNLANVCTRYGLTIASGKTVTVSGHLGTYQETTGTIHSITNGIIAGTGYMTYYWAVHPNSTINFGTINIPVYFTSVSPSGITTFIKLAKNEVFNSSLTINATSYGAYTDAIVFYGGSSNYNLTVVGTTTLGSYSRIVVGSSTVNFGNLNISGTNAYLFGSTNGIIQVDNLNMYKGVFNATNSVTTVNSVNDFRDSLTTIIFPEYVISGIPLSYVYKANEYLCNNLTIREGSVGDNSYNITGNSTSWLSINSSTETSLILSGYPVLIGLYNVNLTVNDSFSITYLNWTINVGDSINLVPWY
jgi:hypothetical protein